MTALGKRHLDALAEFMNMGSGQAAGALAELLDVTVLRPAPPKADYWRPTTCREALVRMVGHGALAQVAMGFSGPVSGSAAMLLERDLARALAAKALGEAQDAVDRESVIGTLEEVGNIVLNATMGSMSNIVGMELTYHVPRHVDAVARNPVFVGDQPMAFSRARLQLRTAAGALPGEILLVVACHVPSTFLRALDIFFHDDSVDRFLLPGELAVARTPCVWSTVLGSCVSVCIRHRERPIAGMTHFLLATSEGRGEPGRFGDTAVRAIWSELERHDADPAHYRAHVFGGAQMFEQQAFDIGGRNIEVARQQLAQLRIPIAEEQVGGTQGVHLRFDTGLGTITRTLHSQSRA